MLASLSGEGLIRNLFVILIVSLVCGAIWFVGHTLIEKAAKPLPLKCWDALFLLVGLVIVVNGLLSLINRQFIAW